MAIKKVTIFQTDRIQFIPNQEDKVALNVIEAHLSLRYGVTRMQVTDAECLRYCIHETIKAMSPVKRRSILRKCDG